MTSELTFSARRSLVPAPILRAGDNARFAYEEFFEAKIRNPHTRRAYMRSTIRFLAWCDQRNVDLQFVTPGLAGEYLQGISASVLTRNQALAALRHFFDVLVQRHAVVLNPFHSVRGEKYEVVEGKTAEIGIDQARRLLRSIDTSNVIGLRDRAILGALAYTGARVGAIANLRVGDLRDLGNTKVLRFLEKGGKHREIPIRHDLEIWLRDYIAAGQIDADPHNSPLFRAAMGKRKILTAKGYPPHSIRQMMKRRLKDAGLPDLFSPHSFRVTVVTDLLRQDIPLEDVQYLAGHSNPVTTRLYDRRQRRVSRNLVERISI